MRLPNAEHAEVDYRKLVDYCLSPVHPVGRHKAVVFASALGLTTADAPLLRDWLIRAALSEDAAADRVDEFGARYRVDFTADTTSGSAVVRSGEDFPRFVTCYVITG